MSIFKPVFPVFIATILISSLYSQEDTALRMEKRLGSLPVFVPGHGTDSLGHFFTASPYIAIVFVTPDCPVCNYYTGDFQRLQTTLKVSQIPFIMVTCGKTDLRSLRRWKERSKLACSILVDEEFRLARALGASVYPEVFLINKFGHTIIYHGKIDDRFAAVGKRRLHVTQRYFEDALENVLEGRVPGHTYVSPVGCFIEIPEKP